MLKLAREEPCGEPSYWTFRVTELEIHGMQMLKHVSARLHWMVLGQLVRLLGLAQGYVSRQFGSVAEL